MRIEGIADVNGNFTKGAIIGDNFESTRWTTFNDIPIFFTEHSPSNDGSKHPSGINVEISISFLNLPKEEQIFAIEF